MAGKLLYSRVLQNKLQKNQEPDAQPAQQKPQSQFYVDRGDSYSMDKSPINSRLMGERPAHNSYGVKRPAGKPYRENQRVNNNKPYTNNRPFDHNDRSPDPNGDGNKIRRGPGRRIAKEKRASYMDPALMQKYSSLPEGLQEKVNATIQICYQQYMADRIKNPEKAEQSHYDTDVEIDAEGEILETQVSFDE